jgi:hypothetical protein
MAGNLRFGVDPDVKHRLHPGRIVETAENLARRVSTKFPDSNLAGLSVELAGIARATDQRAHRVRMPIYLIRVACGLVVLLALSGLVLLVRHIHTRWEFNTIADVFESADAGVNILIVFAGGLWFLITIEARFKRKRALAYMGELLEFIRLIDVTQLYFTPELYVSGGLPGGTTPRFDYTYLLFCTEMLAVIGCLAPLYTRDNLDETVWRAASDVESLANSIEDRLLSKAQAIRD